MTFKAAQAHARLRGYLLTKRHGEYRLAPVGFSTLANEDKAYYTSDLDDAIGTLDQQLTLTKPSLYRLEYLADTGLVGSWDVVKALPEAGVPATVREFVSRTADGWFEVHVAGYTPANLDMVGGRVDCGAACYLGVYVVATKRWHP